VYLTRWKASGVLRTILLASEDARGGERPILSCGLCLFRCPSEEIRLNWASREVVGLARVYDQRVENSFLTFFFPLFFESPCTEVPNPLLLSRVSPSLTIQYPSGGMRELPARSSCTVLPFRAFPFSLGLNTEDAFQNVILLAI